MIADTPTEVYTPGAQAGATAHAPAKLCAAFSASLGQPALAALVQRMAAALGLPAGQLRLIADLPMGAMAGPASGLASGCTANGQPAYRVAAAGEMHRVRQAAHALPLANFEGAGASETALAGALLREHGGAALRHISGVFSLVMADMQRPWALLANDRLGFSPLFYLVREDLLLAASEVKAIAAVADLQLDAAAYGQFFYIGHLLRHQTLFSEVKALGPGQLIEWQPAGGAVRTYYDFARWPESGSTAVPLVEINDALQQTIGESARAGQQDTLLLSGGLDSRLILGVLLSQGRKPKALTLEHAGFAHGLDGRLAREVAQIAGLEQDYRPTRPNFYSSADALEVFHAADGMTPSFGLFISQVYPELTPALGRVWEGLALDLCLGGHAQNGASLRSNLPVLLASRRANRRYLQHLVQRDWLHAVDAAFDQELENELASFPDTEDGWIRFQMANRKRRRVGMPPHHLYSRKVVALTPGADAGFVDVMWSAPLQQRRNDQLYARLLLQYYPELARADVFSGEHHARIVQSGAGRLKKSTNRIYALRTWAKGLGIAPYLRSLQARLGRVDRAKRDAVPTSVVVKTLRATGFQQASFDRPAIERALTKAEGGSLYWLSALTPVFYLELWRCLFDAAALDALRRDVFVG